MSGPTVSLSDASSAKPTFTAPKVSEPTVLKFYLTVTDPGGLSDVGVVRVKVDDSSTSASNIGDVNGDYQIDSTDYAILKRCILGTMTTTNEISAAGDVNSDGQLDSTDYAILKRYILGTIQTLR